MSELGPTVFMGSLAWIKAVRAFLESDRDTQIRVAFERAYKDLPTPTHYVKTTDGHLGMGMTFADAFSDLVRETGDGS